MSTLKVLSWNMQGRELNWAYLADQADFDIALVQEATYPVGYESAFCSVIHHPKKKRAWGSAIVSRNIKLLEHNNLDFGYWGFKLNGSLAVAKTEGDDPLYFASIHAWHGLLEKREITKKPLNEMLLTDINNVKEISVITHLLSKFLVDKKFIVGGDLNASYERDKEVFAHFLQLGFMDTREKFYDFPQPSFFKKGGKGSSLDHIFTDAITYHKLNNWQAQVEVATDLELSDHAPIFTQYEM